MPERVVQIDSIEQTGGRGQIHLEAGIHQFDVLGIKNTAQYDRFMEGDYSAHYWNRPVLERISHYKPSVICSDSLQFGFGGFTNPYDVWFRLPGSPKEISGKDYVYALATDYFAIDNENIENAFTASALSYLKEDAATIGAGVALRASARLFGIARGRSSKSSIGSKQYSRRDFFRGVGKKSAKFYGAALIGTPFVRWGSALAASMAENSRDHNIYSEIAQKTQHQFSDAVWVNGRTALFIAKTLEAMKYIPLQDRTASIVMGFPHLFESNKLFHSEAARAEAIRNLVEQTLDQLDYSKGTFSRNELRLDAGDYFSAFNLSKVRELKDGQNPEDVVSNFVYGKSPEILRALSM